MSIERVEVAVVGGGPAGSLVAALLAGTGHEVVLLERSPAYRWRACGVFSTPASATLLRRAGLPDAALARLARPVPAMRVEAPGGAVVRLAYGADRGGSPALGYDRSQLDPALFELARSAGADVRRGAAVVTVEPGGRGSRLLVRDGTATRTLGARIVVGADGIRSVVARDAGVTRLARLPPRIGLTFHVAEGGARTDADARKVAAGDPTREARMVVLPGAYCGLAPVPGGRLNIGIVLAGPGWRRAVHQRGAASVAKAVLRAVPRRPGDDDRWRASPRLDAVAGAAPIGHRVARRVGAGWLLVGDAAGFLDPFTGEGLHRALVSAELAAGAIGRHLAGESDALPGYERAMRRRFAAKDLVSVLVQAFLGHPALFDYVARRLATRDAIRDTLGLVMGDLAPAGRALDPRFLVGLLAP